MKDTFDPKGYVTLKVYEQPNKLLQQLSRLPLIGKYFYGKEIWSHEGENLIVDAGRSQMAHLLAGDTVGNFVEDIACGTNATATDAGDTAITGAVTVALGAITYPGAGSVKWDFTFGTGDANGLSVVEFGLLTGDGTLFSRVTRAPIAKTAAISIVGTWQIDW